MIHPLYIDGTLAGQDYPLPDGQIPMYRSESGEVLSYRTVQYGFHGNGKQFIFLVAFRGDEIDAEALAEYVLSPAAKKARIH